MPVRKIGTNYRSLTGQIVRYDGVSNEFESSLERDFLELQRFDRDVISVEEQPITIQYTDSSGRKRTYTPDFLVRYGPSTDGNSKAWVCLYEIKFREDLKKDWFAFRARFKAALHYARQQGWRFQILTEVEIRTPYLWNARFLRQYDGVEWASPEAEWLLYRLRELREADAATLLASVKEVNWNRAELLPFLWRMIAVRRIGADLTRPLTMQSPLWASDY